MGCHHLLRKKPLQIIIMTWKKTEFKRNNNVKMVYNETETLTFAKLCQTTLKK